MSSFKFKGPLYEIMDDNEEGRVLTDKNTNFKSSLKYVPVQKNNELNNLETVSKLDFKWNLERHDTDPSQNTVTASIPYVIPNLYIDRVNDPVFYNPRTDYTNSYFIERKTETDNIADYGLNITPIIYSTEWYSGEELTQNNGVVQKISDSDLNSIINIANKGDMYLNRQGEVFRCSTGYSTITVNSNATEINFSDDIILEGTVSSYPSDLIINDVIKYYIKIINNTNNTININSITNNNSAISGSFDLTGNETQIFNYSQTVTQEDVGNNAVYSNIAVNYNDNNVKNYQVVVQKITTLSEWEYITTIKGQNGASTQWYYGEHLQYSNNIISVNGQIQNDDILHTAVIGDMYLNNQSQVFRCKMDEDYDNNIANKWDYLIDLKSSASEQVGWTDIELKYYNQNSNPPSWSSTKDENSEYFVSEITSKIENNSKKLEIKHDVFDKIKDLLSEIIVISAEQPSNNNEITKLWIRESTSVGGSNVQSSS